MKKDADLDPLRARGEFQKLLAHKQLQRSSCQVNRQLIAEVDQR
jgi:hypothetical protein